MKKYISKLLVKRGFKILVREIKNLKKMNSAETIEFLFSKKAELIAPWQFKGELLKLAKEIEIMKPKVIVEIGTANGGTLFMTSQLAHENALIISIDLPGGNFGGGYPDWKIPIYKSFKKNNQTIELIRGDSHSDQTFKKLKALLNGNEIDYLFIDGDHTYEGAKMDFERYRTLVKESGKIGFHDIVVHKGSKCNVYELWNEIKQDYEYQEFVNDWEQNQFGIGLIKLTKHKFQT